MYFIMAFSSLLSFHRPHRSNVRQAQALEVGLVGESVEVRTAQPARG
jgi:hypothetical protein